MKMGGSIEERAFEDRPAEAGLYEGLFVGAMATPVQDGIQFLFQLG
jgi:hypothetical protein